MVRLALLGAGRIGKIHGRNAALHPQAKLVSVTDPHQPSAEALAAETGARVSSIDEAIAAFTAVVRMNPREHLIAGGELTCCQRETLLREWLQLRVAIVRKFSKRMRPSRESFGCSQRVRFLFQSSNDFSR